jgi:uncharacterized protein YegL
MKVNSRFTFDKIRHDKDNDIHLVIDLVAPKAEWQAKRPPLCIVPVVDRSGSMSGDKLHYAKQSLLKLVEHLSSEDYFGLVSFETSVHVDAKPEKMTSERKEQMKAIIGRYQVAGGTGLSAGLLEALKMVNNLDLHESTLSRVILFTDGQPTHGVTTAEGLRDLVGKQMGRATVSTFGYGNDACQELLQGMSTIGKGNYAFVKDPDSALSAFGKELGGLLSTYAQNITVQITPRNGHRLSEVLTDLDVEEEVDGQVTLKIPQVVSEETMNLVIKAKMNTQKSAGPRAVNAFDIRVDYQILDADGNTVTKTEEVKAKIQFVKDGEEQTVATKAVDEIVARAQLVKTQIAAEEAAKRGDYVGASNLLSNFQADAQDRGHAGVVTLSSHLGGMYGSSANYAVSAGSRTSMRGSITRGVGSMLSIEDQAVMTSVGYVTTNSTQALYADAFAAAPSVPEAPALGEVTGIQAGHLGVTLADWVGPTGSILVGGPSVQGVAGLLWNGQVPPSVVAGASSASNPILIAPAMIAVEPTISAKKVSRKKSTTPKSSGTKKSRSSRW